MRTQPSKNPHGQNRSHAAIQCRSPTEGKEFDVGCYLLLHNFESTFEHSLSCQLQRTPHLHPKIYQSVVAPMRYNAVNMQSNNLHPDLKTMRHAAVFTRYFNQVHMQSKNLNPTSTSCVMPNHAPPQATRGSERGCDTSVCETPPSHELGCQPSPADAVVTRQTSEGARMPDMPSLGSRSGPLAVPSRPSPPPPTDANVQN